MKNLYYLIIVLFVFSSTVFAKKKSIEVIPEGKVYIYKKQKDQSREIEIYFPKNHDVFKKKVPGIIMFHGGGWGGGHRRQFRHLCHYFSNRGIVAATVTYKLAEKSNKENISRKRVCITDAKSAIRWYKENASKLGIDPKRIIAGGGSAGGHISLLATINSGLNDPADSKEYDTNVVAYLLFNPALGKADVKDPEVDFMKHLNAKFSPAIVFFGNKDKWLEGWDPAYKKMKDLGIQNVQYWSAKGQGHSFFNKQPWKDITVLAADRFLTKLGYVEGQPKETTHTSKGKLVKMP